MVFYRVKSRISKVGIWTKKWVAATQMVQKMGSWSKKWALIVYSSVRSAHAAHKDYWPYNWTPRKRNPTA